MKVDRRTPTQQSDLTLMNARRKEKKQILQDGIKPSRPSEWLGRSEHMKKWFQENPQIKNFLSYGTKFRFTWTEFKAWRLESEIFSKAIDECMALCLIRREGFLEEKGELCKIFIKEQAIYNPILADYEKELKNSQVATLTDTVKGVFFTAIKETEELNEHIKKKGKK